MFLSMEYPRQYWGRIPRVGQIVGGILAAVLIVVCGAFVWRHYHQPTTAVNSTMPVAKPYIPPPPPPANDGTPMTVRPSQAQLELGFIAKGSGKGPERAYFRQLVADPQQWGFKGNVTDVKAVKRWAGHEAHVITIEEGQYYFGIGDEIRTHGDVAYLLQKDASGNTWVAQYVVPTEQTTEPTVTMGDKTLVLAAHNPLPTSIAAAHFYGVSPVTGEKLPVPHWEYVYFPHAG